jgi:hypothetical protein
MPNHTRAILEIRPARDSEDTPEAMAQFLAGLTGTMKGSWWQELRGTQPTITLEIASLRQQVYFVVSCDESQEWLVRAQLTAQYKTAMVTRMQDYLPPWTEYGQRYLQQLVLKAPSYLPIKTYKDFTTTDPLVGLLGVLSKAPRDTAGVVQIVIAKAPGSWTSSGRNILKHGVGTDPEKFEAHPQGSLIESKIGSPAFSVGIRLFGTAASPEAAQLIVGQMAGSFGTFALSEANSFGFGKGPSQAKLLSGLRQRSMQDVPRHQYLNLHELASLWHLPNLSMAAMKNLAWGKSIKGEPPANLPVEEELTEEEKKFTTFYAQTEFKNRMSRYGVKLADRRRHFYILGKSGTGKSTLIANMALTDMVINQGIGVIDPHGDLCDILLDHIPDHRVKDVVYLDPADLNNPFRLNPLEVKRPEHKELVASGIVAIFAKIFHYSWGPRLEYILRNTLMTLVEVPGSTLVDVINILTNDQYRAQIVAQLPRDNMVLVNFWEKEFNVYPDKLKTEAIAPILNKVGQFVGSPTIRRIIGHPVSTVDLEEIMNTGKIVLLNLSQGKLGEDNATLLGAMFITQFQQAAMNRVNIPEDERRDFFLYVDEFQNFATTSFIKILSEARKYRLGLILANQYTAQLPEEIQSAIFGNVGSVASFVVGADDADRLMKEFGGLYTTDDLVSLDKFQIINKVAVDNRISGAFPAYTLPLPNETTPNRQVVIDLSRERYQESIKQALPEIINKPLPSEEEFMKQRMERKTEPPQNRNQFNNRGGGGDNRQGGYDRNNRGNRGRGGRGGDRRQRDGGGRNQPQSQERRFQATPPRQPQTQRPSQPRESGEIKKILTTTKPVAADISKFPPAPTFDGQPHTPGVATQPSPSRPQIEPQPTKSQPTPPESKPQSTASEPKRTPTAIFSQEIKSAKDKPEQANEEKKVPSYKDIFG